MNRRSNFLLGLALVLNEQILLAVQDEPVGNHPPTAYNQTEPQDTLPTAALLRLHGKRVLAEEMIAQVPSHDGKSWDSLGFGEWLHELHSWQRSPEIQSVMEMVPGQIEAMRQLDAEVRARFLELIKGVEFCDSPEFEQAQAQFEKEADAYLARFKGIFHRNQLIAKAQWDWILFGLHKDGVMRPEAFSMGVPGISLTDEEKTRIQCNAIEMREWLRQELLKVEEEALRRMTEGVSEPGRRELLRLREIMPRDRVPRFDAFFQAPPGGCPDCSALPPLPASPAESGGSVPKHSDH